jgi:hypothetical protein
MSLILSLLLVATNATLPSDTVFRYRIVAAVQGPAGADFVRIGALAMDSVGHVYIADRDGVHVADTNGRYLRRIAGRGRGPGEVMWVRGLAGLRVGGVWAIDYATRRYSRFTPEGRFVTSIPRELSPFFVPWPGGTWNDGFLDFDNAIRSGSMQPVAVVVDSTWSPRTRLALPKTLDYHVPFAPAFLVGSSPGRIWFGLSDRYRVHGVTLGGDTTAVASHSRPAQRVTRAERDEAVAAWRSRMGRTAEAAGRQPSAKLPPLPATKPFFQGLVPLPDGGLGVIPIVAKADQDRILDLFDVRGRFRGTARLPHPLANSTHPIATTAGLLAALELPDGEERVFLLRLER